MLKLQYFGHLMWRANSLEKTLMLGKIEGMRRRGWQRIRWLDGTTDSLDMSLSKLCVIGKDRETRHAVIHGVTKGQIRLNWTTASKHIWTSLVAQSVKDLSATLETIFEAHYCIPGYPELSCFMFTRVLQNDIIPPEGPSILTGRLQRKPHFYICWTLRDCRVLWQVVCCRLSQEVKTVSMNTSARHHHLQLGGRSRREGRKGALAKPAV